MPKYIGQPCTSCRNVFKEGDEIVVCPECGSPYHKECYRLEGKCVNTLLHESGSEWHPEPVVMPAPANATDRVCPNCGTHNNLEAYFCTNCGTPLSADRPVRPIQQPDQQQAPNMGMPGYMPPYVNVRTVSNDTDIDGNTVGEYSAYVGKNKAYYYIPKFLRFASKNGGKFSFNLPAFFLSPFWFFYRKMPQWGILTLVLSIVTGIPTILQYFLYGTGMAFLNSAGFAMIAMLCGLVNWIMSFACGIFGNYLYYRKAKADIEYIKANEPDVTRREPLYVQKGGPSVAYLAISLAVLFAVSMVISAVIMPGVG